MTEQKETSGANCTDLSNIDALYKKDPNCTSILNIDKNYQKHKNAKSRNNGDGAVEDNEDHRQASIIIDQSENGEMQHKVSKNTIGIEDPYSSKFQKRGHWLTCTASVPVLRRFSISGTEQQTRCSRKRSDSSSCTTPRRSMSSNQSLQYISSFHRSLKLLGLQPKDLGINVNTTDGSFRYSRPVRMEPTFTTRLTKRSFSLESLRNAIQDQIEDIKKASQDSLDRKTLSNAVYEEWYFQKQEEFRRKKEAEEIEKQKKEENLEKLKEERRLKTEENFIKWKEQKRKQKSNEEERHKKKNSQKDRLMQGIRRSKSNQDEVFQLWKREKDKIIKQKKVLKSEKDSGNKEDKKASAQKAYSLWKKQADEIFKEKKDDNKKKKESEEKIKRRKEQEKKENATTAFNAWKRKKDEELKTKIAQKKLEEEERKDEKMMQESERLYDAERAFEDWLSNLEDRRNEQIKSRHKARQKLQQQAAWYPGGSVH